MKKVIRLFVPALAFAALAAGCNSNGAGGSAEGSLTTATADGGDGGGANNAGNSTGTGTGNGNGETMPVGDTCVSADPDHLCVAIKFVTYTSNGVATASEAQAANILNTMNSLFSQCNIGFQIETYAAVDPAEKGLSYGAQSQNQLDAIRRAYSSSNQLLGVTTGPWGTAVNGWTNMPGSGTYGAIMEASIVEYGGGIIHAHEFGHYLGLGHGGGTGNLMNPVIYTTSRTLTESQCQTARSTINGYWAAMKRG